MITFTTFFSEIVPKSILFYSSILSTFDKSGQNIKHPFIPFISILTISFLYTFSIMTTIGVYESLKRVTLELGGKSPNIILPDADLSRAIRALSGVMFNQGQVCSAGSRLFVPKKMYDNVMADLVLYSKN